MQLLHSGNSFTSVRVDIFCYIVLRCVFSDWLLVNCLAKVHLERSWRRRLLAFLGEARFPRLPWRC